MKSTYQALIAINNLFKVWRRNRLTKSVKLKDYQWLLDSSDNTERAYMKFIEGVYRDPLIATYYVKRP